MEDKKKEKLFMRDFFRKAGKAIYDYELIEPGDRILVGVSGGKDSLALLEVLALRARDPKQNYTVVAAHIAVENVAYEVDGEYVRQFCEQLGVEFIHRTIATAVKEDSGKPVCFVCSWNRRKTLFGIAKEYGCNKLALGHHRDDAIESLLMSMMFNGTIASMPPKLAMFDRTFTLIRPFIYLTDEGKKIAEMIYERHRFITAFLTSLGVDEKIAAEDACRIEHVISEESFAALKEHIKL